MKKIFMLIISCAFMLLPLLSWSQVTPDTTKKAGVDSLQKVVSDSTLKVDTVRVVIDTVVKKDCYDEYYDAMRTRGAKPVTDGMQQVVFALKGATSCNCFMGQIEVVGGKIKPPLYFQAENGEYKAVTLMGKKLEPAFTASMSADELYSVKDGMSIVFRTADQEYGRIFFYKFANKGNQANKLAPSPKELLE